MSADLVTTKPVLVSGANGYIASHIVKMLLEKGYSVRGTVRDPANTVKVGHLKAFPGAEERLELVKADLTDPHAFDTLIDGCEYVLHTASPYIVSVTDPKTELVEPALKGTTTILEACVKANVKKVVLTSSVAAVCDPPELNKVYTEDDWNTGSTLDRNPYYYSKTVAERRAWKIREAYRGKEGDFALAVINPSVVWGPDIRPENSKPINESVKVVHDIFNGGFPAVIDLSFCVVDVRDVAAAHIKAMEKQGEEGEGRFLCANETRHMREVVAFFQKTYPKNKYPGFDLTGGFGSFLTKGFALFEKSGVRQFIHANLGRPTVIDNSNIKERLGINFIPLEQTMKDTAEDLNRRKHITLLQ